ncbi:MAG: ABC transporter permease [Solirubrobacterales bacterium]
MRQTASKLKRLRAPQFLDSTIGKVGFVCLTVALLVAIFGPLFAPNAGLAPVGAPGAPPGPGEPLGTDFLGRDVLSRLLDGGQSVVLLGAAATLISYLVGLIVGISAGYGRPIVDAVLMRSVDVLLAFPALVILLLLVTGFGNTIPILLIGVAVIQLPGIARIVRTATQQVITSGYVEAAISRGERTPAIIVREIIPNISPILIVDIGLRFGFSVLLVASMNYLGLGLQPPQADWGLMIAENRLVIGQNALACVAPAILLGLLMVGVNLVGDAYGQTLGRSRRGAGGSAEVTTEAPGIDPSTLPLEEPQTWRPA